MKSKMKNYADRTLPEKIAVLLRMMGEETAARVLRNLPRPDVHRVAEIMMQMEMPSPTEAEHVAREFYRKFTQNNRLVIPGEEFTRLLITKAFDEEDASGILEEIAERGLGENFTFDSLNRLGPGFITNFIKTEHPQTMAVILAHLDPPVAGRVISELPEESSAEVILRLARMQEVSHIVLEEISKTLKTEMVSLDLEGKEIDGLRNAAEILNHADRSVESNILAKVQEEDSEIVDRIQQLMFIFNDLVKLKDRDIQQLLREVDTQLLAKALRGAGEEVKDKILNNMSARAATAIEEDMDALGPTKLSDVEEAQIKIVEITLRLRDEGRVELPGAGDDDVYV